MFPHILTKHYLEANKNSIISSAITLITLVCSPRYRGKYCLGERQRYRICNTTACPDDLPTFRDIQCSHFDTMPYKGKLHKWVAVINRGEQRDSSQQVSMFLLSFLKTSCALCYHPCVFCMLHLFSHIQSASANCTAVR